MTIVQKQLLLAFLGCMEPKDVDGIWGPHSAACTAKAQRKLGIPDDGVWGEQMDTAAREYIYAGQDLPEEADPAETDWWSGIQYWRREEFRCQCGGRYCNGFPAEPDRTLVELVDDLRRDAGAPGHRSSGLRCPQHNANEGGEKNSKHMYGKALDFYIEGVSGQKLLAMAKADPRTSYAYIISGQYVHVDVK